MVTVNINTEYINLGQLLKMTNIVGSGGEIKHYLFNNDVFVNDILEERRGRKLYHLDVIRVEDQVFEIQCLLEK